METDLKNKIKKWIFYPEVYVYPTPRSYKPLKNFNLSEKMATRRIVIIAISCQKAAVFCRKTMYLREKH